MTIRVLIADDHAVVRDGLKALLESYDDIRVVSAVANGREAVREALELKPDIVVMDLAMPELNGVEATRMLTDRCPETRVVMLSMHSSSEHVYRALAAGAAAYLLKESPGEEVAAAVRAVHAGGRYLSGPLAALIGGADVRSPLESLSAREREVLQLVVEGKTSSEIAAIVHLSPKSVETYRSRVMKKLRVADLPTLIKFAIEHGLTPSI